MESAVQGLRGASQRTGVPLGVLADTAGIASASKGNLSLGQSLAHVEQAARITRQPGQLPEVAMGLLNVSNFLGTTDPKTAAGFLLAMGEQSPVPQMSQIAANLVPAAKNVAARGGTPAEAAAIVNTLASSMQDPEGRMAGTAAIALSEQLPGQGSPLDRIKALQQNQGAARAFIDKASFEKKAQASIEALLNPNSPQSRLLQQNVAKFPSIDALAGQFDEFVGNKESFDLLRFERRDAMLGQGLEEFQLENSRGQRADSIRQALQQTLEEVGTPDWFGYGPLSWRMRDFNRAVSGGEDPETAGLRILRNRKSTIGGFDLNEGEVGLIDKMIGKLDAQLEELRAIRGNQRTVNPEAHRE